MSFNRLQTMQKKITQKFHARPAESRPCEAIESRHPSHQISRGTRSVFRVYTPRSANPPGAPSPLRFTIPQRFQLPNLLSVHSTPWPIRQWLTSPSTEILQSRP